MRIGILNVYDGRNLGDQAIVEAQRVWLSRQFPGAETRIFSHHFAQNRQIWKNESIRSVVGIPPEGSRIRRLTTPLTDWLERRMEKRGEDDREFDGCDFYTICGGGYLYSSLTPTVSRNLWVHCINAFEALSTGKPVLQFPQSFGPITKPLDIWIIRKLASKLPVVTPRDQSSLDLLESMGFGGKSMLIPDIVFGLRRFCPEWFPEPLSPPRGLGIAPVDFRFAMQTTPEMVDEYLAKLVQVGVEYHRKTGEKIYVFSQVTLTKDDDDGVVAQKLHNILEAKGVPVVQISCGECLKDYLGNFQELRAFIGCRMHACIFSLISGVPTIGLSYQPKFQGAFQHVGRPDWTRSIKAWSPQWAAGVIEEILGNEATVRQQLRQRIQKLEEQIDLGLTAAMDRSWQARR
ncbi:MAG: polysaccharide pyruvyl transferase family protein [Chthoniobacteraceae bacterium]